MEPVVNFYNFLIGHENKISYFCFFLFKENLNDLRSWQSLLCVWFLTKHSEAEFYNLFYHLNFMFS